MLNFKEVDFAPTKDGYESVKDALKHKSNQNMLQRIESCGSVGERREGEVVVP